LSAPQTLMREWHRSNMMKLPFNQRLERHEAAF
jgi:hypothetical protein